MKLIASGCYEDSIIGFKKDLFKCMEKRFIIIAWILPLSPQEIPKQLIGFQSLQNKRSFYRSTFFVCAILNIKASYFTIILYFKKLFLLPSKAETKNPRLVVKHSLTVLNQCKYNSFKSYSVTFALVVSKTDTLGGVRP